MPADKPRFIIEPRNKFVEANRSIVEFEIRPKNTVSFMRQVNLTKIEDFRARQELKTSYTAFVVKALAIALREFPYANRRVCRRAWRPIGTRLQRFQHCDIAVACERAMPGAECVAFADILRDADKLSLDECTEWLKRLSSAEIESNAQWREFSRLIEQAPSWLAKLMLRLPYLIPSLWTKYRGAAAIVSSPAKYGVDAVIGSWSWPIGVSFGLVQKVPMVVDDRVVACPSFQFTLNFDRRIMAGAQAARFFKRITELLENADELTGENLDAQVRSSLETVE